MVRYGFSRLQERLGRNRPVERERAPDVSNAAATPAQSGVHLGNMEAAKVQLQTDPREFRDGYAPKTNDVFIAVMGVTGAGKSTFISLCTEKEVQVGHNLQACTQDVSVFLCNYKQDVNVYLIDTPGFDDTDRSDAAILKEIAAWLTASYSNSIRLHGIVYLHRISDPRMQGSAKRNLFMFKKLCGVDALKNVILATTMWERLQIESDGTEREKQLQENPEFWGWMIENGSQLHRHYNTRQSAMRLIESMVNRETAKPKIVLDIQEQMVDGGKNLVDTAAGQALDGAIAQERERFTRELAETQAEKLEALAVRDKDAEKLLRQHQEEMNERVQRLDKEQSDLKINMEKLQEERFAKMKKALEDAETESKRTREALLEAKREQERKQKALEEQLRESHRKAQEEAEASHKREVAELQEKLKSMSTAPEVIIKSRTRSHPGANTMDLWSVSVTLWAEYYFWVAYKTDSSNVPKEFSVARTGQSNGNRYVALGDQDSWYVHFHDAKGTCWTERSSNFKTVYKEAENYMVQHAQFGCPTCASFGLDGYYFLRTAWGCSYNIPVDAEAYLKGDNVFLDGMSAVQSVWFGKDGTWVATKTNGDTLTRDIAWNLKGIYPGLEHRIKVGGNGNRNIKTLAMNPHDGGQWIIVWENGLAAYDTGILHPFDAFEFEEWCTQNFGTIWNSNPQ